MADDTGSASLEFVTVGLILLVPLVYLVLALAAIQAGALAAEGAARQAARVYVQSPDAPSARDALERAILVGLGDHGVDRDDASVSIDCDDDENGCLTRRNSVTVTVRLRVELPLVPDVLSMRDVVSVPVQARATQQVSRFWGAAR
ncbi:hypothetical protein WDJ51_09855 [Rathayibacter sp. YIM 133350]|uniref:hypothetical protein n=1 Tax=Rathayibacter sp. YIM 133350 TaxID=3131992 RepID=UPI00307D8D3F